MRAKGIRCDLLRLNHHLMCVHFSCIAAILVSFIVCSVVYSIFFFFFSIFDFVPVLQSLKLLFSFLLLNHGQFFLSFSAWNILRVRYNLWVIAKFVSLMNRVDQWLIAKSIAKLAIYDHDKLNVRITKQRRSKTIALYLVI